MGDLLVAGLRRLGAIGIGHGPVQDYQRTLEIMVSKRIDAVVGVPVQVLALARQSKGEVRLGSVLLSADYVPESITEELQRVWGGEIYTHYGMTEMGFGGGVECEARMGYHMREVDLYFEIVDPQTGAPLEEGESGEVVFTTLTRRGMPLIRYRTGDLSRWVPEICPCGTVLKTMARLKSHTDRHVELESRKIITMADLDEALFRISDLLDFSADLSRRNNLDTLQITATMLDGDDESSIGGIIGALNGIPVIRSTVGEGKLALSVITQGGNPRPLNSRVKRTISDGRN